MLMLPAVLALVSFLLVSLLYTKLVLNPRYFTIATVPAAIAAALWLTQLRPPTRWGLVLFSLFVSFLMASAQNAHPRWSAKALVQAAAAYPGKTIQTDQKTHLYAELPLLWQGLTNVDQHRGQLMLVPEEQVPAGGEVLARYPSPPTRLGAVLKAIGLERLLPEPVERRLIAPNPTMLLVQVEE
jgi:hypothetical protein